MCVTISKVGRVALVQIDNPPVNAIGQAVRQGLLDALERTEKDASAMAVVLHCVGRTFIAGADVREFGTPPAAPHLPEVLAEIEAASKPWIAAIHGTALGGGLETALVCAYRMADEQAKLGLPEVNLGIIPGAGGTVRLPRVVDAETALRMIVTGKPLSAQEARACGLVDEISRGDLLQNALAYAEEVADRPVPERAGQRPPNLPQDQAAFDALADRLVAKARGQTSPGEAAQAVRDALRLPLDEALRCERARFVSLRGTGEARALRHIFFAERASGRINRLKGASPRPLTQIGIVGGGTMGAGIASACLLAGLSVVLIERNAEAVEAGGARVRSVLDESRARGLISDAQHAAILADFAMSQNASALGKADLVIEAVFEDMGVKRQVFADLDAVTRSDCVLATNTSYLDVTALAEGTKHPDRVLGLHFFSPAHIMKLLEIVVPAKVSNSSLATGLSLAKKLRKIPVFAGVCDGFIANRIMSKYRREADYMLEDGAMPWDVDAAMVDFGFPMGIFQMQDLAGLDISWAMRKRQSATRDPAERYVDIGDKLCEQGSFGRKSGRGYYVYDEKNRASPSAEVEQLILAESARKGIERTPLAPDEINARILAVMQAEGQRVLDEGIAQSADDIDVVLVNAFGFPRWKGGPMFLARNEGTAR